MGNCAFSHPWFGAPSGSPRLFRRVGRSAGEVSSFQNRFVRVPVRFSVRTAVDRGVNTALPSVNGWNISARCRYTPVPESGDTRSPFSLLTLRFIRRYIRRSHAVMMTAFFAVLYALGSMLYGGMLILTPLRAPYVVEVLWGGGAPAWNYPGLLVVQSWGVLTLPFFATISMVVVAIGVGIGMSVAVLLGVALVRDRRARAGQPATVGSVAGLTPAMIALVTLGACCSTTAAATAGVGIVGQVSGSSTDNLLLNNWYLGVFQMVVVWVALIAQELLLRVYGSLFQRSDSNVAAASAVAPRPLDRNVATGGALRAGLLVGGLTWSLAMLVAWTDVAPANSSAALWFTWIVQHQVVSVLAIVAALFPRGLYDALTRRTGTWGTLVVRGVLLAGGVSLAVGVPPPISGWGVAGFGNELLAILGVPTAWGASPPVFSPGLALSFRWGIQYLLLGGFAIAIALAPERALIPLLWSAPRSTDVRTPTDRPVTVATRTPATPASAPSISTPGSEVPPTSTVRLDSS
jgi:hypothetical protein